MELMWGQQVSKGLQSFNKIAASYLKAVHDCSLQSTDIYNSKCVS